MMPSNSLSKKTILIIVGTTTVIGLVLMKFFQTTLGGSDWHTPDINYGILFFNTALLFSLVLIKQAKAKGIPLFFSGFVRTFVILSVIALVFYAIGAVLL